MLLLGRLSVDVRREVVKRSALLVAEWMRVGYVHVGYDSDC